MMTEELRGFRNHYPFFGCVIPIVGLPRLIKNETAIGLFYTILVLDEQCPWLFSLSQHPFCLSLTTRAMREAGRKRRRKTGVTRSDFVRAKSTCDICNDIVTKGVKISLYLTLL